MKVVAVVPAHNEAMMIAAVVRGLLAYVNEAVVVDDGSTDETGALARGAGAVVVRHLINRGQGAALETGTLLALGRGADIIVHFDADGQHDPEDIPKIIAPIVNGSVAVVLGSRFLGRTVGLSLSRRVILRIAILFTRFFSGLKLTDAHNGFRAFSRQTAAQIRLTHDGMAHASEILDIIADKNLPYVEVPITVRYTTYSLARGQGSLNSLQIIKKLIIEKFFHNN